MNILIWIVAIFGGAVGMLSTVYLVISLPVVIVQKFIRKIRFGTSLFN